MTGLQGRTVVITGASRGIGRAIAIRAARDGANVVIAAKTADDTQQKLKGTIFDVASEVLAAGGQPLPLEVDVRDAERCQWMAEQAAEHFGGIDVLVNNAGAIQLTPLESTPPKRFDLLMSVNVRASYVCSHACLPWLKQSTNAHIINMAPPIRLEPEWIAGCTAYTMSKYGMSLLTLGLAGELRSYGIGVHSLWPKTLIATAAVERLGGDAMVRRSRKPDIVADAFHLIATSPPQELTGSLLIDEDVLRHHGVTDFSAYAHDPEQALMTDLYVGDWAKSGR